VSGWLDRRGMTTFTAHISSGARRRAIVVFLAAAVLGGTYATASTASPGSFTGSAYGWPVKPFDRPHPIRGSFGDPRTIFTAPPTQRGLMTGGGSFSFHFGVDISAPDGTEVYPVVSGTVSEVTREWVGVDTGNGRSFQYWHIRAAVSIGQRVEVDRTVLGTILRGCEHVHFTELHDGRPVNPLAVGHLSPYLDTTTPWVEGISFRSVEAGPALMPNFLRGRVEMLAEAYDTPTLPVPGEWSGMPVAPALISWRIEGLGGRVVVPETIAVDFRSTIPADSLFWSYYARGTYQNMSVFGPHFSWREPGSYLFKLTRTSFDTKAIRDGVYDLVVTATDIRGNQGSLSRRITIHNRAGWIGS
jgi:murein DD-endopeptidase MepM/ murein hydrolase activator NlpD